MGSPWQLGGGSQSYRACQEILLCARLELHVVDSVKVCLQVYAALNALGELPWRINTPVLEVIERAVTEQLPIAQLPHVLEPKFRPKPKAKRFRVVREGGQLLIRVCDKPPCRIVSYGYRGSRLLSEVLWKQSRSLQIRRLSTDHSRGICPSVFRVSRTTP